MVMFWDPIWTSIRKEILVDIERRFGKKVEHVALFSCIVYDFVFVQFLISPLFIATWRGTWENEDTLFDQIVFQGNMEASSALSLILGAVVSALLVSFQHEIKCFAHNGSRLRFFAISRFYTFLRFSFDVLTWKGIWGLWDIIIGSGWLVASGNLILPSIILFACGCFRSTHSAPVGMGMDRPSSCIAVSTAMSTKMDDTFLRRFLDALATSVLSLLSISSFYGLWVIEDLILGDVGRETDDPVRGIHGGISYVFGLIFAFVSFGLQFLSLHLDRGQEVLYLPDNRSKQNKSSNRILPQSTFNLVVYDIVLILAQIGNVSIFRGIWNMIDAFVWPEYVHLSRILCQFLGLFYVMLLYAGTSLHGGINYETNRKKDGILFPNYFLTYLLARKQNVDRKETIEDNLKEELEKADNVKNNNFEMYEKFESY